MILHNLTKIKLFRILLAVTYPLSALLFFPLLVSGKRKGGLFFFFDRYSIGGAQKIHLDILESVRDKKKTVFFTRKSLDKKLKKVFYSVPNAVSVDIHFWCDNLLFRLFAVHYYSFLMNRHEGAVIFSANSTFFYDMLPYLNKRNRVYEMLHNFTYGKKGMEFFGLANYRFIDRRMVYDTFTYSNLQKQYDEYGVPEEYKKRITFLEYGVLIPPVQTTKKATPPLKILYAGRGAAQKRIWLLNRIAEHFMKQKAPVEFTFAGSMAKELSEPVIKNSIVHHEIGEQSRMNELYGQSHVIILTSNFEGFPVVIKEGMSYGCIPLVTALPGNKSHLKHLENALLIEHFEDEDFVVKEGIAHIELLLNNPGLVNELSTRAYHYAKENFTKEKFLSVYHELLTRGGV